MKKEVQQQKATIERPEAFRHQFVGSLRNGKIPLLDVVDSPNGNRYGFADGVTSDDRAKEVYSSGLEEYNIRIISPVELAEDTIRKGVKKLPEGVLSERTLVEAKKKNEPLRYTIFFKTPKLETISQRLDRKVAFGEIVSWSAYDSERDKMKTDRMAAISSRLETFRNAIENTGATILRKCKSMDCVDVLASVSEIQTISHLLEVKKISLDQPGKQSYADGRDVNIGLQMEQYLPSNGGSTTADGTVTYDGQNRGSIAGYTPIRAAVIDFFFPNDEHPGFFEASSLSTHRIKERYRCTGASCSFTSSTSNSEEGTHASKVASRLMGDVRDEQDNSFGSGLIPEQEHSGVSGETNLDVYNGASTSSAAISAFDNIIGKTGIQSSVIVMSVNYADSSCVGSDAISTAANNLFEDDKLLFNSPSNIPGNSTQCGVRSPGSAIGVFTVGGTGGTNDNTSVQVRDAGLYSFTPWGGNSNQRSIIDGLAQACHRFMYNTSGTYSVGCGTSYAAPTFAGAMTNFTDWYINHSGWADIRYEPGRVFSNALLFGDRSTSDLTASVDGFHHRWGSGRLRVRRYDNAGMDGPWGYKNGWTCVGPNDEITLNINGGYPLPSSVDDVKAVIWWYDKRHESPTLPVVDDIDMELWRGNTIVANSNDYFDNKERVYSGAMGGQIAKIKIKGYNISATNSGCSGTRMKVWWAYFFEDDARNDSDGPTATKIEREQ